MATATNRTGIDAQYFVDLDSAIVDIQLFGTVDQISAAQSFAGELAELRVAQLDKLLASLRNDLRKELKLEPVEGPIVVLRPSFDTKEKS